MTLYVYACSSSKILTDFFKILYWEDLFKFADILKLCFKSDDDDNGSIYIDNNKTRAASAALTTHAI